MHFERISKTICFLILILLFSFELSALFKKNDNFQLEIYPLKIDLLRDSVGVIRLIPGVGVKKAEEIIELRKTIKSTAEIIRLAGLNKRLTEIEPLLQKEDEK